MHASKCCGENLEDWDAAKAERIIMKWAAANPEPRYPTWNEYLCSLYYGKIPPYVGNIEIPADIAKKLGVEPIREDK